MSVFVADDGAGIYYENEGSGKPVVLIHGWDANRKFFRKQIPELSRKYRVISLDLRGHGDSDRSERTEHGLTLERCARDIKGLLSSLELRDATLVGWSMGASVIFEYIRQFGCQDIGKICVIDMTPKLLNDRDWDLGATGTNDPMGNLGFLGAIARDWEAISQRFVPLLFAKPVPVSAKDVSWAKREVRNNTPHCMLNLWISMALADYRDVMEQISVPTLLAFAESGYLYDTRHAEYLRDHIRGSKLVMFPGCGHALHIEDATKFNQELMDFVG